MAVKTYFLEITLALGRAVQVGKPVDYHLDVKKLVGDEPGVIDEHSFSLEEITAGAQTRQVSVQYLSDQLPLMPADTPPAHQPKTPPVGAIPRAFPTAAHFSCVEYGHLTSCVGTFTWMLTPSAETKRTFRLSFDLYQEGSFIQNKYKPCVFKVFRPDGSIPATKSFSTVEIAPHITSDKKTGVSIDGKPFATYNYNPERKKPYFYPVFGPSGVEITNDGKPHDPSDSHVHHHSIWIAHQRVGDVNFWEQWPGNGEIVHQNFDRLESGPVYAAIDENNQWQRGGRIHAYELRRMRIYRGDDFTMIDVEINMSPETQGRFAGDLTIGKTIWGFLAARVKESMTPMDNGGEIRNSRGGLGEDQVIWEEAEWMDISGPATPMEWNGVAIFDTPSNASYPNRWQCRNDGFICTAFSCDRDFVVKMGDTLTVRHRVFIHKHNAISGNVAGAFEDYISGCEVSVKGVVCEKAL